VVRSLLIAIGGNSLIRFGEPGTIAAQFANARRICEQIADLVEEGYHVVVTHGNGPQVGAQLLRSEAAADQAYPVPLEVCVAMTQGEIGYILQTTLQSVFTKRKISTPIASLVSRVLVNHGDVEFRHPTKPIGPFYTKQAALQKSAALGWTVVEDASRGYRRVVPSPLPCAILDLEAIRKCLDSGMTVITLGGGGIPVVAMNGAMTGVEAVVDKDRASGLLARQLHVQRMIISTDVEFVYLNFSRSGQTPIHVMDTELAAKLRHENHFFEGSMKPKIEAAMDFLEAGGEEVIITDPEHLHAAVEGSGGTHIFRDLQLEHIPLR